MNKNLQIIQPQKIYLTPLLSHLVFSNKSN